MTKFLSMALATSLFASAACAQTPETKAEKPVLSPSQVVDEASASEWVRIAADDLLVMTLSPGTNGEPRQIVIQLMPAPFSMGHIGNIRKLAKAHWWDGTSVNRAQDNYVVQWGDPGLDNPEEGQSAEKPLPGGLVTVPQSEYTTPVDHQLLWPKMQHVISQASNDYYFPTNGRDAYANETTFIAGWPVGFGEEGVWPVHCYGAVGIGRNYAPDTGSGAELYTVIGHAPRHLDRNIGLAGRIVEGMEHLSTLPRGKGEIGFYADKSKRVPIVSIRLASELPTAQQPRFEFLNTDSQSFADYAAARANRRDRFFIVAAGGADVCNIPVPVRRVKKD